MTTTNGRDIEVVIHEVWHAPSANLIAEFDTKAEALAYVRNINDDDLVILPYRTAPTQTLEIEESPIRALVAWMRRWFL